MSITDMYIFTLLMPNSYSFVKPRTLNDGGDDWQLNKEIVKSTAC